MMKSLRTLRDERAPQAFARRVMAAIARIERFAVFKSPVGEVYVSWNARGISAVMFAKNERDFAQRFTARFERPLERAREVPAALRRALGGDPSAAMGVPVDLSSCSEFERAVLRKTLEIPRGEVRPYNWIAREIGRPKAVRAVGTALKKNPVPLLVPCHRVVRGDGMIGQYALGGAPNKALLLRGEGVDLDRLAAAPRALAG